MYKSEIIELLRDVFNSALDRAVTAMRAGEELERHEAERARCGGATLIEMRKPDDAGAEVSRERSAPTSPTPRRVTWDLNRPLPGGKFVEIGREYDGPCREG
jgi:hypothetical protein